MKRKLENEYTAQNTRLSISADEEFGVRLELTEDTAGIGIFSCQPSELKSLLGIDLHALFLDLYNDPFPPEDERSDTKTELLHRAADTINHIALQFGMDVKFSLLKEGLVLTQERPGAIKIHQLAKISDS